jgi:hypothetical protein
MLNIMKAPVSIFLFFLLISCGQDYHNTISGNGNVIQNEIVTNSFSIIDVSDKIDAEIILSVNPKVIIEADENLINHILIEVKGNILSVSSDRSIRMARSKKVMIYCNKLEEIKASSGSYVFVKKPLQIDNLEIRVQSGADMNLSGDFINLDINGTSGSDISISGRTQSLAVNLSSAANLDAYDLKAEKADVNVSSAADAKINVIKEAYFRASSAADIIYKGSPEIIDSKSSSAGDIKKASY